jgi:two-component system heavy metal sensor histidine kinase CusS
MVMFLDREADDWLRKSAQYLAEHGSESLSEPEDWTYGLAQVINDSGKIRFASEPLLQAFPLNAFPQEGRAGIDRIGSDGRTHRLLTVRQGGSLYYFAQDRSYERDFMILFRRNIAIAALPTLAVCLIIGYFLTRLGLRPIRQIISAARNVSPQRLHSRVPVAGQPSELRELAETLNSALEKMEDAFGRLDAFSADVAHELRTPVHNLHGGIEVALSQERTHESYRQTLLLSLNEVDRLGRLVDRLLLFAKSEDPRSEIHRETVDVTAELEDIREFFAATASESEISIFVESQNIQEFPLDRSLFQRALSNLVANALAHTSPGGSVRLVASSEERLLRVAVADTGAGIARDELPFLFDRFYRSRSVRSAGRGVGLGLAIVKRVVDLHGGTVRIDSAPGAGTTVHLAFPAAE